MSTHSRRLGASLALVLSHVIRAGNTKETTAMAEQPHLQRNQCPACTMQLSTRQSLRRHWANLHKDRDAQDLEVYLQQYGADTKKHECPSCGKAFSRSNICKEHQEREHGEEGLKRRARFTCPVPECTATSSYFVKDVVDHCMTHHYHLLGKYQSRHVKNISTDSNQNKK